MVQWDINLSSHYIESFVFNKFVNEGLNQEPNIAVAVDDFSLNHDQTLINKWQ